MKVVHKNLQYLSTKESGRSSDFIAPTIAQGCAGGCRYCYAARYKPDQFYGNVQVSDNMEEIIEVIQTKDVSQITKPNQTHSEYITWDIACNADLLPVLKDIKWEMLFNYFKYSDRDMATLATKFVNPMLLKFNPNQKVRVRMSLMPQHLSEILEPNTAKIEKRMEFMNKLYDAGYNVQVNFSPVIVYQGWLEDYQRLFERMKEVVRPEILRFLGVEVIFLTHNKSLHDFNVSKEFIYEDLLWNNYQESKISNNGVENVRYRRDVKAKHIEEFKAVLKYLIKGARVRYIF